MYFQKNFSWTPEERMVLNLWAFGKTHSEVVSALGVTEKEYAQRRLDIFRKVETSTEAGVVAIVITSGLVLPDVTSSPVFNSLGEIMEILTEREIEVLCTLAKPHMQSATLVAVARELKITESTLKKHLERVYRKLYAYGVSNRASATCLGMKLSIYCHFVLHPRVKNLEDNHAH